MKIPVRLSGLKALYRNTEIRTHVATSSSSQLKSSHWGQNWPLHFGRQLYKT